MEEARCAFCSKVPKSAVRCPECNVSVYCNKTHLNKHAEAHKEACREFSTQKESADHAPAAQAEADEVAEVSEIKAPAKSKKSKGKKGSKKKAKPVEPEPEPEPEASPECPPSPPPTPVTPTAPTTAPTRPKQTQPAPARDWPAPAVPTPAALAAARAVAGAADEGEQEEDSMGEMILKALQAKQQAQQQQQSDRKGEEIGEILEEEKALQIKYDRYRAERGITHHTTLEAALELAYSWIGLYKLEPTDRILTEIMPHCKEIMEGGPLHIKCIQSTAFLRFKQHRFLDALILFLDFRKYAGNSAELCENIGHTYNSLSLPEGAEKEFTEALRLMDEGKASQKALANRGGVLLGLGVTKDRLGKPDEGLKFMLEALTFYRGQFKGVEHSLIAKTLTSCGHAYEKLKQPLKAEEAYREAVRIFKYTCGDNTPLTANALNCLADCLLSQLPGLAESQRALAVKKLDEAEKLLRESLSLYTNFDTLNVYLATILEILNKLTELHTKHKVSLGQSGSGLQALRTAFLPYTSYIRRACDAIVDQKLVEDGNIGAFFKCAAETCMLAQEYELALNLLKKALVLFERETSRELSEKAAAAGEGPQPKDHIDQYKQLADSCKSLISFVSSQVGAAKSKKAGKKK